MFKSKTRIFVYGLIVVALLLTTACGGSSDQTDTQVTDLEAQIAALQDQLDAAQAAADESGAAPPADPAIQEQLQELQSQLNALENQTVIEFWTTDNEEDRVQAYEAVAASYMELHPEVEIRIVPIEEAGISQRISTAVAANRLPDIVRMGIERVSSFAADGILDEDAAVATIQAIGEDDFRAGPLQMVTDPDTGKYAAVPFDGWIQAIWYRQDVFDTLGLNAPIAWEDITNACETLPGNDDLLYGIGLGTDPGQNYGHQVFEQVAISNDAWPFDEAGNVTMNTPEMIAALQFYTDLQDCAIPGPQYWRGAREAYEYGQSGMLFYS
ncbi:MAG: extracellular solute-binding protein, partial [Anaerolineales bacterium]